MSITYISSFVLTFFEVVGMFKTLVDPLFDDYNENKEVLSAGEELLKKAKIEPKESLAL